MKGQAYSPRFDEAVAHAVSSFRTHRRKATDIPYVTHLMHVCAYVGEHGGDEDQLIAAILHDWLEDVPHARVEELQERFGDRVARLVRDLSDSEAHPKPPWRPRKEAYLRRLREKPAELKLISAADKLHNAQCILRDHRNHGDAAFSRFTGGKVGTLWYYRGVVEALDHDWAHPLLEDLRATVLQLHVECGVAYE
jgi:(p)ppGpp synthase/HD superfamily hydrolase